MSDGFLGRWSRRKIEAKERTDKDRPEEERPDAAEPETAPDSEARDPAAATPADEPETLSEEEIAALPPIESLTIDTDITPFLRRGVPKALKNAAMRKMWLLDPAIRNYRDVALDYAYDWNAPGGVPGNSGAITSEAARKMLEALLPPEKPQPPAESPPESPAAESPAAESPDPEEVVAEGPAAQAAPDGDASRRVDSGDLPAVAQAAADAPRERPTPPGIEAWPSEIQPPRRRRGGATPV